MLHFIFVGTHYSNLNLFVSLEFHFISQMLS